MQMSSFFLRFFRADDISEKARKTGLFGEWTLLKDSCSHLIYKDIQAEIIFSSVRKSQNSHSTEGRSSRVQAVLNTSFASSREKKVRSVRSSFSSIDTAKPSPSAKSVHNTRPRWYVREILSIFTTVPFCVLFNSIAEQNGDCKFFFRHFPMLCVDMLTKRTAKQKMRRKFPSHSIIFRRKYRQFWQFLLFWSCAFWFFLFSVRLFCLLEGQFWLFCWFEGQFRLFCWLFIAISFPNGVRSKAFCRRS